MRLFFALPVTDTARSALAEAAGNMRLTVQGRYVRPESYHITLAFIGETDAETLPVLGKLLEDAVRRVHAPILTLTEPGFFGRRENAVLWYGFSGAEPLSQVSGVLVAGLHALRLPHDDKPFRPHITLARQADLTGVQRPLVLSPPVSWHAEAAILYESRRTPGGMIYTPLLTRPFNKPPGQ